MKSLHNITDNKGRNIANVRGKWLYKTISGSKHILRHPPAICWDVSSLKQAADLGVEFVRVIDRETGRVYETHLETLRNYGFQINRCHGEQWAMMLDKWLDPKAKDLFTQNSNENGN